MLSDEEIKDIKQKLISHIETSFPPEQILSAKSQIEAMNGEQLESFLEKNKLVQGDENAECVFCNIASGKINSVKLGEDNHTIAVLEINPISRGHFIVIPKDHSENSDEKSMDFAKKISKKVKEKLKAKEIEFSKSKMFGHEIINVLPIYENENFNSERNHAKMEELEKIKEEIEKEEIKKEPVEKEKPIEFRWLPKRIP